MNGRPFTFADAEATFGPQCTELIERLVTNAPRFTPEQILRGRVLFASFRPGRPTDQGSAVDAA